MDDDQVDDSIDEHIDDDIDDPIIPNLPQTLEDALEWVQSGALNGIDRLVLGDMNLNEAENAILLASPWKTDGFGCLWINYGADLDAQGFINLAHNDDLWALTAFDNKDHGSEQLTELIRLALPRTILAWYNSEIREAASAMALCSALRHVNTLILEFMMITGHAVTDLLTSEHLCNVRTLRMRGSYSMSESWDAPLHLHNCHTLHVEGRSDHLAPILSNPGLSNLARLRLYGFDMASPPTGTTICAIHSTKLHTLTLDHAGYSKTPPMHPQWLQCLFEAANNGAIERIDLRQYKIPPGAIAQELRRHPHPPGGVDLHKINLSNQDLFALFDTVEADRWEELTLVGCGLERKPLHTVLSRHTNLTSLRRLNLGHNPLGHGSGKLITGFLKRCPNLTHLNIAHTRMSLPDIKTLAKALPKTNLQSLAIGGNRIDPQKLAALAPGLPTTLTHLDLSVGLYRGDHDEHTHWSASHLQTLADCGAWRRLARLDLHDFPTDDTAWSWLQQAPTAQNMTTLSIDVPDEVPWTTLLQLDCLPALQHLQMSDYWRMDFEPNPKDTKALTELLMLLEDPRRQALETLANIFHDGKTNPYETDYLRLRLRTLLDMSL